MLSAARLVPHVPAEGLRTSPSEGHGPQKLLLAVDTQSLEIQKNVKKTCGCSTRGRWSSASEEDFLSINVCLEESSNLPRVFKRRRVQRGQLILNIGARG